MAVQGRNKEAMSLYKLISRHSSPHVAKSAKRLLFGFTAGDYLKAHTITCVSSLSWKSHEQEGTECSGRLSESFVRAVLCVGEQTDNPSKQSVTQSCTAPQRALSTVHHDACRYSVQKGAYDEYFSKLTGQYNNIWSAPEGEDDRSSLTVATVAATAVILTPLVLIGAKIGMQWMR